MAGVASTPSWGLSAAAADWGSICRPAAIFVGPSSQRNEVLRRKSPLRGSARLPRVAREMILSTPDACAPRRSGEEATLRVLRARIGSVARSSFPATGNGFLRRRRRSTMLAIFASVCYGLKSCEAAVTLVKKQRRSTTAHENSTSNGLVPFPHTIPLRCAPAPPRRGGNRFSLTATLLRCRPQRPAA